MSTERLRVLLVPDSTYWILGTIAKGIARANPWMDATILSGSVLQVMAASDPRFFDRFDLVHFVCPYASRRWLENLHGRIPVVTSHHHVTDWKVVSHNVKGDAIIMGSPEWVQDMAGRGVESRRLVCVPYGVDSTLFAPASAEAKASIRARLGLQPGVPVVGFFAKRSSNDDDRKGVDVFSRAVSRLHAQLPDASVVIVGPGWREMVAAIRNQGITCVWIPFLERLEDVAPLYGALDFYWVTARVEGGPVPLLEAMSSEVCCISTPVGLARELIEDGVNGVILPMNDPDAFASTTASLWNNSDKRSSMSREARRTIQSRMHMGQTLRGVGRAYDAAFGSFLARTGGSHVPRFEELALSQGEERYSEALPLRGLNRAERKRAGVLEAVAWSESLFLHHGQRRAALRLMLKAVRTDPLSTAPVRSVLRHSLPPKLVRSLVAIKKAVKDRLTGHDLSSRYTRP